MSFYTYSAADTAHICQLFQVPKQAYDTLEYFITEQEAALILEKQSDPFPAEPDNNLFISAYQRGVLNYTDASEQYFIIANFYERLDVMVISDQETYRSIPKEKRKAIADWAFNDYLNNLSDAPQPTADKVLTLQEMLDFFDENAGRQLYLNNCDCKSMNGECGRPVRTCITYKDYINTYAHRGHSEKIDIETAKQIVREADKAGLMHTANPNGICNCCDDCCYLSRARKARNSGRTWPYSNHLITRDEQLCIHCGLCVQRCWYHVFKKENGVVSMDNTACIGCGLCANTCPVNALALIESKPD